jgi:UDP-N-acetyl-D-mannosaminuronic acid transferase (WecB/TagA/CpsF family)
VGNIMVSVRVQKTIRNVMDGRFATEMPAPIALASIAAVQDCRADHQDDRRILGIDFFSGSGREAVARMKCGGLLVVPSAPALKELDTNLGYRDAVLHADLCIPDSSYMILIWNMLERDKLHRLSGLEYLAELLKDPDVRQAGNTLWILASPKSARTNLAWLAENGIHVPDEAVYIAPMYGRDIEDRELLECVDALRPKHIIVTVGGGTQERVGMYLKRNLSYLPAIHCIGAAIAFLSGDQVNIPSWADFLYLGWLFRCASEPRRYVPRYWEARKLFSMMIRHRSKLPPIKMQAP